MNRNIRYAMVLMAAVAMSASCAKNDAPAQSEEEIKIDFDMTKAPPTVGTTFGFMVYYSTNTESTDGLYSTGTYRYDPGERSMLIPCVTDALGVATPADSYDPTKGVGLYNLYSQELKCYMFSPGLAAETYMGSQRIRYTLAAPLQMCEAPFIFNLWAAAIPPGSRDRNNYRTIEIPPVKFINLISRVGIEFEQKAGAFTIANGQVLFLGTEAVYHPVLKLNEVLNQSEATLSPLDIVAGTPPVLYKTSSMVPVFPTDYSIESVISLVIRFDIDLGVGPMTKDIPVSINMEPNMEYLFHVDVTSKLLTVTYTAMPVPGGWDDLNNGSDLTVGSTGFTRTLGSFPILSGWTDSGQDTTVD
ncbi:hypothetical protein FACS1894159_05240 [Bacteroidia bacterium]|nr:hypothetical protein FACS1894159_05240 [Bacteroidia bacterium]